MAGNTSCVVMAMDIAAQKAGFNIAGAKIIVSPVWAEDKPVLVEVNAIVILPDQLSEKQLDILRKGAHSCPIHNSLRTDVKTTITFEIA